MKNKFWFLIFMPLLAFCSDIDQEIIVSLAKSEELPSIYISCPSLKLKEILLFDLSQNGITKGISGKTEEENRLLNDDLSPAFWKPQGYAYVAKISIHGSIISGSLFSLKTGQTTPLEPHHLTGVLASDRRVMHAISDQITEIIGSIKGISQTQIFYAVQFPDGSKWKSEIWAADYDGKNARQLTQEKSYCISPLLFPKEGNFTKNRFLYVNYKLGQPKIYISSFDAKSGKPFLSLRGNQLLPSFSNSGDMIAFICDAGGQADLFLQAFDPDQGLVGKPLQLYSFPNSVQASPTFRPDGKKVAFVSDQEGSPRIFLISIPSFKNWKRPHPVCLTRTYRENTCPSWSPDGTKLAYSAKIDGVRQIMVYDFITQEEIQLTKGKSHKENPCWAANSMHIIFNTVDPSSSELFLINLKQKEMVQITEGPGKKHYPTWGP
ncbi:MAG: PD40 domain-containing protein [Simkania sp.]|nr:PD40 domain-containing protein [Simkania sp.]